MGNSNKRVIQEKRFCSFFKNRDPDIRKGQLGGISAPSREMILRSVFEKSIEIQAEAFYYSIKN